MVWEWIQGAGQAIADAWNGFCSWLSDAIGSAWDALYSVGQAIANGAYMLAQGIMGAFAWIWEGLRSFGEWLWQGLCWIGEQVYNALYTFGEWIINGISWLVNTLADFFVYAYNTIRDAFESFAEQANAWVVNVVNAFVDKLERIIFADITLVMAWTCMTRFAKTGKLRYLVGGFLSPLFAGVIVRVLSPCMRGSAHVRKIPEGTPILPLFTGAGITYTPTEPEIPERQIGTEEKPVVGAILDTRVAYNIMFPAPTRAPRHEVGYEITIREPEVSEESMSHEIVIREPAYKSEQVSYEIVA